MKKSEMKKSEMKEGVAMQELIEDVNIEGQLEVEEKKGNARRRSVMLAEEKLAQMGAEAARIKDRVSNAVEDKYDAAKRAVRRGKYVAEDLIDETSYRIKRDPLSSVAVTFGVGVGLGVVIGWLVSRDRRG